MLRALRKLSGSTQQSQYKYTSLDDLTKSLTDQRIYSYNITSHLLIKPETFKDFLDYLSKKTNLCTTLNIENIKNLNELLPILISSFKIRSSINTVNITSSTLTPKLQKELIQNATSCNKDLTVNNIKLVQRDLLKRQGTSLVSADSLSSLTGSRASIETHSTTLSSSTISIASTSSAKSKKSTKSKDTEELKDIKELKIDSSIKVNKLKTLVSSYETIKEIYINPPYSKKPLKSNIINLLPELVKLIQKKKNKPIYISINDQAIELRDANDLTKFCRENNIKLNVNGKGLVNGKDFVKPSPTNNNEVTPITSKQPSPNSTSRNTPEPQDKDSVFPNDPPLSELNDVLRGKINNNELKF